MGPFLIRMRRTDTSNNVTTISDGLVMRENRYVTADYETDL